MTPILSNGSYRSLRITIEYKAMKYETLYLMVRAVVQSEHHDLSETVNEVETSAICSVSSTGKVTVLETEILLTRVRNIKKQNNGKDS